MTGGGITWNRDQIGYSTLLVNLAAEVGRLTAAARFSPRGPGDTPRKIRALPSVPRRGEYRNGTPQAHKVREHCDKLGVSCDRQSVLDRPS